MESKIIFNGLVFRRYGNYYRDWKGRALHREVWRASHGEIPPDYVVHHIDGDPFNNDISNLLAMPRSEHPVGRPAEYTNPKRLTIYIEESDYEAGKMSGCTHGDIFRMGMQALGLDKIPREEVLSRLAAAENRLADEHQAEAEMHRHRALEMQGKIRNGQISGPVETAGRLAV